MYVLTGRDWVGVSHALVALFMVGAAVALLLVSIGGAAQSGSAPERIAPPSAGAPPQIAVRTEMSGVAFHVANASFRVVPNPSADWAFATLRQNPGAGRRWIAAAVEVTNLGRRRFNPGLLSYLLRGPGGALFAPDQVGVVGPTGLGTAGGLPVGARAVERLVFRVPTGLRRAALAIQPSPTRPLELRVPLGSR